MLFKSRKYKEQNNIITYTYVGYTNFVTIKKMYHDYFFRRSVLQWW